MARFPAAILFGLVVLTAHAQTPPAGERWDVPLDPRDWKLVQHDGNERQSERAYVRHGDNAYFWNERIVSGFRATGANPEDYIAGFVEELMESCRPLKVSALDQDAASILFQWQGDCRIYGPQIEFRRVMLDKGGLHYFAYATKPGRLSDAKKELWLATLRGARLK